MPNYFGIMKYSVDNDINILTILLNIKHVFFTYVTFYQSRSQPMWNHFSQSNLCFLNTFHHTTLNCHCFCTDLYHHFFSPISFFWPLTQVMLKCSCYKPSHVFYFSLLLSHINCAMSPYTHNSIQKSVLSQSRKTHNWLPASPST